VTLGAFDVNGVHVSLKRDGELLHEARSAELMGDQLNALKWLVNRVIELGYVIDAGHLLMTGALGPAHPAAPGRYLAAYTGMGEIEFYIE
jgi:2-keto-4-pentenoate hydratase